MNSQLQLLRNEVKQLTNSEKAKFLGRFFKTGKGEYAEGEVFAGITVPESRKIAKKHYNLPLSDVQELLKSKIHEERLIALLILVDRFQKGTPEVQKEIFDLYLASTKYINNWDLVDLSAEKIVGGYLLNPTAFVKGEDILSKLARSESLWERRIAIIATFQFILHGEYNQTLKIAEMLLHDQHHLIQKAVGWMLREVGKRYSEEAEEEFLKKHYKTMPRTMLRYAIERFPTEKRLKYLKG